MVVAARAEQVATAKRTNREVDSGLSRARIFFIGEWSRVGGEMKGNKTDKPGGF